MGDLVWVRIFFAEPRMMEHKAIIWQVFPCKIFFPNPILLD